MLKKMMIVTAMLLAVNLLKGADVPADIAKELAAFNQEWSKKDSFNDPNFSIENIVKLLNLDYVGMEKVKSAVEDKNWELADTELLNYFRASREKNYVPVKSMLDEDKHLAVSALKHEFKSSKAFPVLYRGVKIDWTGEVEFKGEVIQDHELYFQLQRLKWWRPLAKMYDVTKDEDYFFEWRYELVDYADRILPITKDTSKFVRRGMETYCRTSATMATMDYFIRSKNFDSKLLRYLLWSFHHQAEHIRTVYSKAGNHLVAQLYEVYHNSVGFPEFKKAPEWKAEALERFPQLMNTEMYSDGMNRELIFNYHGMYISLFSRFYMFLKENNEEDLIDPSYVQGLKNACDIFMYQTFPDWTISQFGSSKKGSGSNWAYRQYISPLFPENEHYKFMLTQGKKGKAPSKTSVAYPVSGFYFFRNNWTTDAIFMSAKCSEVGEFHNQIDNGTFELAAYGRNLMIDSGCYSYNSDDPKIQAWRNHFRSTKLHQTLTLNNENHNREPKFLFWDNQENLTALSFENASYENLTHRRTILFVDQKYFVIYDEAIGSADGDVRIHFQFVPCKADLNNKNYLAKTLFDSGANLAVQTFPTTKNRVVMEEEKGLISYKHREKESRPAWSYKQVKGTEDIDFLTVLAPYKGTKTPDLKSSITKNGDIATVELNVGNDTYNIVIDWSKKIATIK